MLMGCTCRPFWPDAPRMIQIQDPFHVVDVQEPIDPWFLLTVAMNAMNRSMGNHDC